MSKSLTTLRGGYIGGKTQQDNSRAHKARLTLSLSLSLSLVILLLGLGLAFSNQASPAQAAQVTVTETFDTAGTGTYVVPDGVASMTVEAWGGGGGGSGGYNIYTTYVYLSYPGVAGGGGGYTKRTLSNPSGGTTLSYVVGAKGGGGGGGYVNAGSPYANITLSLGGGASGGASSVDFGDTTIEARGGGGGGGSITLNGLSTTIASMSSSVGVGGSASNGDVNISGQDGTGGIIEAPELCYSSGAKYTSSGKGGDGANGGAGGASVRGVMAGCPSAGSTISGNPGVVPGGGGGGGLGGANGGAGADGMVRITLLFPWDVTIDDVSPNVGDADGGTTLTITGTDLSDTTAVKVGGVDCQSFDPVDNETVTCVTPAGTAGTTVDVSVTSHGVTDTAPGAFTYQNMPVLTGIDVGAISPSGGPPFRLIGDDAHTNIIIFDILGTGLADTEQVLLRRGGTTITIDGHVDGGNPCAPDASGAKVRCQLYIGSNYALALTAGIYDIATVSAGGLTSNILDDALELIDTSFAPQKGLTLGGETITFYGEGLGARAMAKSYAVQLSGPSTGGWVDISAACTVVDDDEVDCTMPANAAETVVVWLQVDTDLAYDYIQWDYVYEQPTISFGLSDNEVSFVASPSGGIGSGYTVATVETNSPLGYTLSLVADGEELVCESDGWTIPSIASTGSLIDDTWGYGLSTTWAGVVPDLPANWRKIPTNAADGKLADPEAPTVAGGDKYGLYFGAQVSYDTQACTDYTRSLMVTVIMK